MHRSLRNSSTIQKVSKTLQKEKPTDSNAEENTTLLAKLLFNPETAALLKALAKTI